MGNREERRGTIGIMRSQSRMTRRKGRISRSSSALLLLPHAKLRLITAAASQTKVLFSPPLLLPSLNAPPFHVLRSLFCNIRYTIGTYTLENKGKGGKTDFICRRIIACQPRQCKVVEPGPRLFSFLSFQTKKRTGAMTLTSTDAW